MSSTSAVDLHTGKAVWSASRRPPLHVPRRTLRKPDVIVIGTGITGALAADELSAAGCSVLLLDKRNAAHGASSVSTALLQAELDVPLTKLRRLVGLDSAMRHWQRSKLALRGLVERVRRYGLEVELEERDSLYLAGDVLDADGLREEVAVRRAAGLEARFLSRDELRSRFARHRDAALWSHGNFSANPVKLNVGLLNEVLSRPRVAMRQDVEVVHVAEHGRSVSVALSTGEVLEASWVLYATGYELPNELLGSSKHQLNSTWAIATPPQPSVLWPGRALIWEASDPYLYLRATEDGRIICGGEDEEFVDEATRDALLPEKTRALEKKLKTLVPEAYAYAAHAWTGTFGSTPTGTPSVGPLPGRKRTMAVLGYGGNGFTFAMLAAQLLRGYVEDDVTPDATLYAF